ncbi:hypothetical protein P7C73_g3550, partial [Tremellales sp. Uapishka_1]
MAARRSSPPPRSGRSPSSRRSSASHQAALAPSSPVPLVPTLNPSSMVKSRHVPTDLKYRAAPPIPPLPASPALPSPASIRRSSSGSSSGSGSSQHISTPSPRRSRSGSKLLPALPLSVSTLCASPTPKGKRVAVDYSGSRLDEIPVVVVPLHESPPCTPVLYEGPDSPVRFTNSGSPEVPPRPARRSSISSRRRSTQSPRRSTPPSTHDLLPPQPTFRATSPSGDSFSTVTVSPATTPRPTSIERPSSQTAIPASNLALATALEEFTGVSMPGRKRDSAQRRLSALRGLVGNLDFGQPWSSSEKPESSLGFLVETAEDESGEYFWACSGEPDDSATMTCSEGDTVTQISVPMPLIEEGLKARSRPRRGSVATPKHEQTHGWPSPTRETFHSPPDMAKSITTDSPFRRVMDSTPVQLRSTPKKNTMSTPPPRRAKMHRSASDLHRSTPEPPRPGSRQRGEVFDVASGGYSKSLEPNSPLLPTTPTSTWRSSLSSDEIYQRTLATHGPIEIKRQEVIWEMCETEHAFVKSMRTVLRLFAIPLKTPQGKWIEGIPHKITELFDSLEAVACAHGIISAAQRDLRRRVEVMDVATFVQLFRSWVGRLEVHEWYLLRFESVVQMVEDNVRDENSVFGEFVRMQMKEEVLGSMSLGSMLLKPVQRLTKYPLFLKRLLDVTPHPHPSHPDILSLLSSTESIILTLQATKAREEDFEQLQLLESRLVGLPEHFTLAIRGRKLIGQGQVCRVLPPASLSPTTSRARAGSFHSSRGSISSSTSSSPWDTSSSHNRSSAFSVSSAASSNFCQSPARVSRSPSTASSLGDSRPSTPSSGKSFKRHKEDAMTLLVFDDLVILTAPIPEKSGLFGTGKRKNERGVPLRVVPESEGGIGKIVEVKDWSGWAGEIPSEICVEDPCADCRIPGHSNLLSVTIVPLTTTAALPPTTNCFTLPLVSSPKPTKASPMFNCPSISSLSQWIAVLSQATTTAAGETEEKEMLTGSMEDLAFAAL